MCLDNPVYFENASKSIGTSIFVGNAIADLTDTVVKLVNRQNLNAVNINPDSLSAQKTCPVKEPQKSQISNTLYQMYFSAPKSNSDFSQNLVNSVIILSNILQVNIDSCVSFSPGFEFLLFLIFIMHFFMLPRGSIDSYAFKIQAKGVFKPAFI
jgi:hypothetical protein